MVTKCYGTMSLSKFMKVPWVDAIKNKRFCNLFVCTVWYMKECDYVSGDYP